jgi:hypothetical protein
LVPASFVGGHGGGGFIHPPPPPMRGIGSRFRTKRGGGQGNPKGACLNLLSVELCWKGCLLY